MYTDQIDAWEIKLALIQQHLRPWTSQNSGIPPWFRDDPFFSGLVLRIEARIVQLLIRTGSRLHDPPNPPSDPNEIKALELELDEIVELSRQLDLSLRHQLSLEFWNDPVPESPAVFP